MLIAALRTWLTTPVARAATPQGVVWFAASQALTLVIAFLTLGQALESEYAYQDDVRSHVFWMHRFVDPGLFPGDLIADYFQAIAPSGYATLYWLGAKAGIPPLVFNKLLPPLLGVITTGYAFGLAMRLLPVPFAAFTAAWLLNQSVWLTHSLVNGTPRAFAYPLFLAFLYYQLGRGRLLGRGWAGPLVTLALLALFYPQFALLALGVLILGLVDWEGGAPGLSTERTAYALCAAGIAVMLLILLPYSWRLLPYGPVVTADEASRWPIFRAGGRMVFFHEDPWRFWFCAINTGVLPRSWCEGQPPYLAVAGLALPALLRYPSRFPLIREVTGRLALFPRVALASIGLFLLAHAFVFHLYLPNRYTTRSLRILLALAAGIVLVAVLDAVFRWATEPRGRGRGFKYPAALALAGCLAAGLFLEPGVWAGLRDGAYDRADPPALYEFFASQPKDILIAALTHEASDLPTFAKRSVLTSSEHSLPFHRRYFFEVARRREDLLRAERSPDPEEVRRFIQRYGVDFWLVDLVGAPEDAAIKRRGGDPALFRFRDHCGAFETEALVVLDARCILATPDL